MDDALFFAEVERLDRELAAVPLTLRPLDIYHRLVGREERDQAALECFEKIHSWYLQRYGKEAEWDGVLGHEPVLLRGRLRVLNVVFPHPRFFSGLDELMHELSKEGCPLSDEEFKQLAMMALEAREEFTSLYNLDTRPSLLSAEQLALKRRAWFDLRNAVAILDGPTDIQGSIVHSHEAAEKFLKVAALHEGYKSGELRRFGHDLVDICNALRKKHRKYSRIKRQARELHLLLHSMETRYSDINRILPDAIAAFRLARFCCGFIATQIQLDKDRGAKECIFKAGRFYRDNLDREFRFCGTEQKPDGTVISKLFLLGATDNRTGHTIDALINFKAPCEFNFVEISDRKRISRLETRYSELQRQTKTGPIGQGRVEVLEDSFHAIASIRIPLADT
jgi:HEPN domain-containing protein